MDYKKISGVSAQIADAEQKKKKDRVEARRQAIRDAIAKRKAAKVKDGEETPHKETPEGHPKVYVGIKDSSNYKTLLKKVKDELSATEDTEAAIDAALDLLHEAPAEQVLAASIEVLGEAIDILEAQAAELDPDPAE